MSTPFKLGVKSGNRAQSEGSAHQKSFQKSLKSEKNKNSKKLDIRDLMTLYLTKLQLLGVSELFSSWCTLYFHDFGKCVLLYKLPYWLQVYEFPDFFGLPCVFNELVLKNYWELSNIQTSYDYLHVESFIFRYLLFKSPAELGDSPR